MIEQDQLPSPPSCGHSIDGLCLLIGTNPTEDWIKNVSHTTGWCRERQSAHAFLVRILLPIISFTWLPFLSLSSWKGQVLVTVHLSHDIFIWGLIDLGGWFFHTLERILFNSIHNVLEISSWFSRKIKTRTDF